MLGVPIHTDGSDSQDLNRTVDTLIRKRGALARRGDGDGGAADRQRGPHAPRRAARLLHVPAPGDGAVRTGPGCADRPPPRRVRLLRRRARSASAVEARDAERLHLQLRARRRQRPRDGLRAAAARPGREVPGHDRPREAQLAAVRAPRDAAPRRQALARAQRRRRGRSVRARARHRRPARGARDPRLHLGRSSGAGQGRLRARARRLRMAARRRQALPADGLERGRADRFARLRRAARGALARAPEPRRLLQGDGRGRHQPGDRPRARDRALLDPLALRPAALDPRRRRPTPARSRPRSRCCSAATTASRRSPTPTTARSPASSTPGCSRTSGSSSATAPARSTSPCSSRRRPRARSSGSSRRRSSACATAPSCWCSQTASSTRAIAATSTRTWPSPRSTRRCARSASTPARRTCAAAAASSCARRRSATSTTSSLALGLGANGVCPYLMLEVICVDDYREDIDNICAALRKGIEKVISTIGIHEVRGYARQFSSIGIKPELAEILGTEAFAASATGGVGYAELDADSDERFATMNDTTASRSRRRPSASTRRSTRRRWLPRTAPPATRTTRRRCASSRPRARSRCAT